MNSSKKGQQADLPYVPRTMDIRSLIEKKSHFLLGLRQIGKASLIHHTFTSALSPEEESAK